LFWHVNFRSEPLSDAVRVRRQRPDFRGPCMAARLDPRFSQPSQQKGGTANTQPSESVRLCWAGVGEISFRKLALRRCTLQIPHSLSLACSLSSSGLRCSA
jgi:hypothetical protein